ncbi:MAG TPA: hypothetical protein VMT50_08920, partial [Steroidobacteraceae bacterium]|nr:hypothetical protein [Steroidobacteraceae bacterium]
ILASFVQADVISVSRALPVVPWANVGCTLIIFVAVLLIHLVALVMLGIAGGCIAFERPRLFLVAAHAVFSLALALFGLKMMSAAAPATARLEELPPTH